MRWACSATVNKKRQIWATKRERGSTGKKRKLTLLHFFREHEQRKVPIHVYAVGFSQENRDSITIFASVRCSSALSALSATSERVDNQKCHIWRIRQLVAS